MPPARASIGKVRMPPGRRSSVCAKKSSKASPRKKLRPRRSAMLAGDGVVIMQMDQENGDRLLPGNYSDSGLAERDQIRRRTGRYPPARYGFEDNDACGLE